VYFWNRHLHRSGIVQFGIGSFGARDARIRLESSALTASQHLDGFAIVTAGNFCACAMALKKGRPKPPPIPQRNIPIFFF
jgi:hypothetical protein